MIYLYIKQHTVTGLKYFGRTIKKNPFKYNGSGSYWTNHIAKHGIQHVQTLEIFGFDNQKLCTEFAIKFSSSNNIVESSEWANLIVEDGLIQNPNLSGFKMSVNSKSKISHSMKNLFWWNDGKIQIRCEFKPNDNFQSGRLTFKRNKPSESTKNKISKSLKGLTPPNKGKNMSLEQKRKISKSMSGLVSCIDLNTGLRQKVSKEVFDKSPNLVGITSKLGLKSIKLSQTQG